MIHDKTKYNAMFTTTKIRQMVCLKARQFFAHKNDLSWSICMKLAWAAIKALVAINSENGAELEFKKISTGEITKRQVEKITGNNYDFKGSDKAKNPYQIHFFDKEIRLIRSFNIETLVSVKAITI